MLWLVLLSYTRWPGRRGQSPWPANSTLAARTGLDERQVERGLAALRAAELVSTRVGPRSGARRRVGRLVDLDLHAPCKAIAPEAVDVGNVWAVAKVARPRPAALVTAMVGAFMLACDTIDDPAPIDEWTSLGCSRADWRRFIGHRDNASWTQRVRELDALGLVRVDGRRVLVAPPRAWFSLAASGRPSRAALPPGRLLRVVQEPPRRAEAS